jgi:hypothetical protein
MKWNKLEFDPETAPMGFTLWKLSDSLYYNRHNTFLGYYSFQMGVSTCYSDKEDTWYTTEELIELNAHWIYPQDLEMPE